MASKALRLISNPVKSAGPFAAWGAPDAELSRRMDCDDFVQEPDQVLIRARMVDAPAEHVYRWLTQMRVAPYSYDWIDNRGKKSPPFLIDGIDELAVGQQIATIFRVVAFEKDRTITMLYEGRFFPQAAMTYSAKPVTDSSCRLFARILFRYPRNPFGVGLSLVLPAGDLVMIRRQFLNFARLAEEVPQPPETI